LSRIVKARDSTDENGCRLHLFPQLADMESSTEPLPRKKCRDFIPVCPQDLQDSGKGAFDASFQENMASSASDQTEADLAEEHANEVKESYSKGFVEGENSGILTERQRVEPALEMLRAAALELRKCRESLVADFEKASVELAIAIAEKIVCHEVSINQETVVDVLKRAANQTGGNEIVKIRINPSELQCIEEAGLSLSDLSSENATLEGDSAVPSGGCVIETDFGCVDATLSHQLEAVAEALREKCG